MQSHSNKQPAATWPDFRTVWRWHFYAGVFAIPFVLILAVTGSIYLFKPQLEGWQDSVYSSRVQVLPLQEQFSVISQVESAVAEIPNGKFEALVLPPTRTDNESPLAATKVIVRSNKDSITVYVDPLRRVALGQVVEKDTVVNIAKKIHGELLLGKRGSYLVELAACWTLVLVVTGLALWWPKNYRRWGGVLYPRLLSKDRLFWRDLHGVGGFWTSGLIVFLIVTGLPWATFWGDYFKSIRQWTGTAVVKQDWESGHEQHGNQHAEHNANAARSRSKPVSSGGPWRSPPPDPKTYQLSEIDDVVAIASSLNMAPPVMVRPPSDGTSIWNVQSETPNRPYRESITIDAQLKTIVSHTTFADRHWVDQMVGQGIAIHEGQRFGWFNQFLALVATSGLVLLSLSSILLWWKRRHGYGILKAPAPSAEPPRMSLSRARSIFVLLTVVVLAICLPLFGISLAAVVIVDQTLTLAFGGQRAIKSADAENADD